MRINNVILTAMPSLLIFVIYYKQHVSRLSSLKGKICISTWVPWQGKVRGQNLCKGWRGEDLKGNWPPSAKTKDYLTKGFRSGAVVRALASHQCGLGSIPRSGVICGLSLLVLFSAPRGFLRVLRFPLSSKNHHLTWFVLIVILSLVSPISAPVVERLDT